MEKRINGLTVAEYAALPAKERALHRAAEMVGQKEQGRNAGPFVTKLLAAIGLGPGFPWCAAFVSYALKQAGYKGGPVFGRGAVRNWAAWAKKENRLGFKPERGDLFFWLNKDQTGHIGFVTQVIANTPGFSDSVKTIEGNTNAGGSREGDGVYRRERKIAGLQFIRL